jgi:hypothetical protein
MTHIEHDNVLVAVGDDVLAVAAARHRPDPWAVAHDVDLHGDPNLVGNDGSVTIPLRRAASAGAVLPGRSVTLGSVLGRWTARVAAWDVELGVEDPEVVLEDVTPVR